MSGNSKTSPNEDTANYLKEWEKARDTLQFLDDKLHDLRKYGFSFLTALLTAESILIPSKLPHLITLAVFAVTLLLITGLFLFDKNWRVYQEAANTRARVLERKLNLELSEVITSRYRADKIALCVLALYAFFILGVLFLGCAILCPRWAYVSALAVIGLAALAFICWFHRVKIIFRNKGSDEDWTVTPLECAKGGIIRITLNNLTSEVREVQRIAGASPDDLKNSPFNVPRPIEFAKGQLIWEVRNRDGEPVYRETADTASGIKVYDSYTWTWDTAILDEGVYHFRPRDWPVPLFTLTVTGKAE